MSQIVAFLPTWNSWLAVLLYWIPLVLCAIGYLTRFSRKYMKERAARAKAEADPKLYYHPSLTVGGVIAYTLGTICPVLNLLLALFDVSGPMFREIFYLLGQFLDQPLVPRRDKIDA